MESNQQTHDQTLATTLLTQVYQDYQKDKRRARWYSYFYYGIGFFILLSIFSSASQFGSHSPAAPEHDPYVGIIRFEGVIGTDDGILAEDFEEFLDKTFADSKIVGIVLEIDSPGGGVYDTYMLYDQIQRLKLQYPDKKVITFVRSVAASGGYWLSLAGDKIYCSRVSVLGSIGVIAQLMNFKDFAEDHKVHPITFRTGKYKGMGNPFAPLTPEESSVITDSLDEIYTIFKETVQDRRGERLTQDPDLFSGRTWSGYHALQLGLVDDYSLTLKQAAQKEFGDYKCQYIRPNPGPFDLWEEMDRFTQRFSMQHTPLAQGYALVNGTQKPLSLDVIAAG